MSERTYTSAAGYRFGFGGQEKDDEISGNGNTYTAEYWEYDARLGRRWNVDPVVKPWESSYAAFANNPIVYNDPTGLNAKGPVGDLLKKVWHKIKGAKYGTYGHASKKKTKQKTEQKKTEQKKTEPTEPTEPSDTGTDEPTGKDDSPEEKGGYLLVLIKDSKLSHSAIWTENKKTAWELSDPDIGYNERGRRGLRGLSQVKKYDDLEDQKQLEDFWITGSGAKKEDYYVYRVFVADYQAAVDYLDSQVGKSWRYMTPPGRSNTCFQYTLRALIAGGAKIDNVFIQDIKVKIPALLNMKVPIIKTPSPRNFPDADDIEQPMEVNPFN